MNTIIANAKKINQISFISSPLVNTITCSLPLIVVTILLRNNDGGTLIQTSSNTTIKYKLSWCCFKFILQKTFVAYWYVMRLTFKLSDLLNPFWNSINEWYTLIYFGPPSCKNKRSMGLNRHLSNRESIHWLLVKRAIFAYQQAHHRIKQEAHRP